MEAILAAKSTEQDAPRRFFKVRKNISYKAEGGIEMLVVPHKGDTFKATVMVDYESQCWERNMPAWSSLRTFKKKLHVAERLSS